ncbi:MAG: hypothetical protein QM504_02745, partial [Pseudomonadota bacterium]
TSVFNARVIQRMTSRNLNDLNQFLYEFVQARVCIQFHVSKKLSLALDAKIVTFLVCLIHQGSKLVIVLNAYRGLINISYLLSIPLVFYGVKIKWQ